MRRLTKKAVAALMPKQRKARVRMHRLNARCLAMCNSLEFWQRCHLASCRRNHTCRGDQHACFARHWRRVPEELLAYARARIDATEQGLSPADAVRNGLAALEDCRQRHRLIRRRGKAV